MKKLVSKLLGCLIAFAPVSSFNSNNYSHADIFGSSKCISGVQVMTEKEFQAACDYVNEKIDKYIERYLASPMGRMFGRNIFYKKNTRSDYEDWKQIPYSFQKKRFFEMSISSEEDELCWTFNSNLPSACCRHWVAFLDKNYFSRTERKYTALGYKSGEKTAHVVFLVCYHPDDNPKKEKWVVLDPMTQFTWKFYCKGFQNFLKKKRKGLSDKEQQQKIRYLYETAMLTCYMPNSELPEKREENRGFLGIPLEKFFVYGKYMDTRTTSQIFWTRDQLGYSIANSQSDLISKDSLDDFLRYIYTFAELDHLRFLREEFEYENKPWYNKLYRKIQKNVVETCDKITDKMCLIDLPSDIELSDDDCMGFGS